MEFIRFERDCWSLCVVAREDCVWNGRGWPERVRAFTLLSNAFHLSQGYADEHWKKEYLFRVLKQGMAGFIQIFIREDMPQFFKRKNGKNWKIWWLFLIPRRKTAWDVVVGHSRLRHFCLWILLSRVLSLSPACQTKSEIIYESEVFSRRAYAGWKPSSPWYLSFSVPNAHYTGRWYSYIQDNKNKVSGAANRGGWLSQAGRFCG